MFTIKEILQSTTTCKGGLKTRLNSNLAFSGISIDTRTLKKGNLFIAIKGPNFDGHDYLEEAFKKGASGAVVELARAQHAVPQQRACPPGRIEAQPIILVTDTLTAFHDIANLHRKKMKAKIVAITGSSGKTTTKDMIASILSESGKTLKTFENFNNEIGVPLTLLAIEKHHKYAVIEMGMQGKGEIALLSKTCSPDTAVITNIGQAHLERLGSRRNIAKAKAEIFMHVNRAGVCVINADDDYVNLLAASATGKTFSFGIYQQAEYMATDIVESESSVMFRLNGKTNITVPLPGIHNVYNALCAIAAARSLKIPLTKCVSGLKKFKPSSKRMDIFTHRGIKIINDTYNANPSSMKAAIKVLAAQSNAKRKIAVLGDMFELGSISKNAHADIGKFAALQGFDYIFCVGKLSSYIFQAVKNKKPATHLKHFTSPQKAASIIKKTIKKGDCILFKASRGMKLEKIVQEIIDSHV